MENILLTVSLIIGATVVSAVDAVGLGNLVEICTLNQIDGHRCYCFDIKGHKSNAKIDKGLQANVCYSYQGEIAEDQGFDVTNLKNNNFFLPAFGV